MSKNNFSEKRELKFKTRWYKWYAPYLYKLKRYKAKIDLKKWRLKPELLDTLATVYWNDFLRKKMAKEAKYFGCYPMPKVMADANPSEIAYILGCGPSIQNVKSEQWEKIRCHYSIGLNLFPAHEFTPNAYFTEFVAVQEFIDFFNQKVMRRSGDFSVFISAAYVSQCAENLIESHRRPVFFYPAVSVKTRHRTLLYKLMSEFYAVGNKAKVLSHQISNLDTVINYCVMKGYKDIRLVGVDLTGEGYFFDQTNSEAYLQARRVRQAIAAQCRHKQVERSLHATAAPEIAEQLGNLTIIEYLPFLQSRLLSTLGVKLTVTNPVSMLAGKLEIREI